MWMSDSFCLGFTTSRACSELKGQLTVSCGGTHGCLLAPLNIDSVARGQLKAKSSPRDNDFLFWGNGLISHPE